MKDFQSRKNRLKRSSNRQDLIEKLIMLSIAILLLAGLLFAIRDVAKTGAEYQCARLEGQFKQFPEHFFITPLEKKLCPELQAPVKEIIN
jgi:hypothetical protein